MQIREWLLLATHRGVRVTVEAIQLKLTACSFDGICDQPPEVNDSALKGRIVVYKLPTHRQTRHNHFSLINARHIYVPSGMWTNLKEASELKDLQGVGAIAQW